VDEPWKIPDGATKDEMLAKMDMEVERFSRYMANLNTLGGGALSSAEKALIKTFMVFMKKES
jgi:hypothetical protein